MNFLKNDSRMPVSGTIPTDPPVQFTLGPRDHAGDRRPVNDAEWLALQKLPLAKMGLGLYHEPDAPAAPTPDTSKKAKGKE